MLCTYVCIEDSEAEVKVLTFTAIGRQVNALKIEMSSRARSRSTWGHTKKIQRFFGGIQVCSVQHQDIRVCRARIWRRC